MKRLAWLSPLLLIATTAWADDTAYVIKSRELSKTLGMHLKQELQQAMQEGGPIKALEVCNTQAPAIAQDISGDDGITVGRTALRVRNPGNTPDDWEKAQLKAFAARLTQGEPPAEVESFTHDGTLFRYMKAIPMQAMCSTCHGTDIPEPVQEKLAELYPEDQATGFTPGELRGAFSVSIPLKED